jgi:hypothetical protein
MEIIVTARGQRKLKRGRFWILFVKMQPANPAPIGTGPAKTMRGLFLMWHDRDEAADADGRQ